jgi:hypothetical protein
VVVVLQLRVKIERQNSFSDSAELASAMVQPMVLPPDHRQSNPVPSSMQLSFTM